MQKPSLELAIRITVIAEKQNSAMYKEMIV
jgi:hypothetical protein